MSQWGEWQAGWAVDQLPLERFMANGAREYMTADYANALEAVAEAARDYEAGIDAADDALAAVLIVAAVHGSTYKGPSLKQQLADLRTALQALDSLRGQ